MSPARPVRLKRRLLGVVCAKCVRRVGGTKPGKRLGRVAAEAIGEKVQVAEVGCLKLCPKRRVVVVPIGGPAHVVDGATWLADAAALLAGDA